MIQKKSSLLGMHFFLTFKIMTIITWSSHNNRHYFPCIRPPPKNALPNVDDFRRSVFPKSSSGHKPMSVSPLIPLLAGPVGNQTWLWAGEARLQLSTVRRRLSMGSVCFAMHMSIIDLSTRPPRVRRAVRRSLRETGADSCQASTIGWWSP